MEKKLKGPGDNVIIRLKNQENVNTLKWLNSQTNIAESIRFLIELDVFANGIKDYSQIVPLNRSDEYLETYLKQMISQILSVKDIKVDKSVKDISIQQPHSEQKNQVLTETQTNVELQKEKALLDQEKESSQVNVVKVKEEDIPNEVATEEEPEIETMSDQPQKKKKRKKEFKFDESDIEAWK